MNRLLLSGALLALALPALADLRPFPANALRGKMTPGYFPDLKMDGKPRQFAPSARIFNEDNLSEVPASLRGSDIVVNYTVDANGQINRVWILSREEAAQPLPGAPATPPAQILITTPVKP